MNKLQVVSQEKEIESLKKDKGDLGTDLKYSQADNVNTIKRYQK